MSALRLPFRSGRCAVIRSLKLDSPDSATRREESIKVGNYMSVTATDLSLRTQEAKARLDAHVREIVGWHFNPETGCPFWLHFASKRGTDQLNCRLPLRFYSSPSGSKSGGSTPSR